MLYAISESYFIEITEIACIRCEANDKPDYPYRMYIRMNDGQAFITGYRTKIDCQRKINEIVSVNGRLKDTPVTRYEFEAITRSETEKLKRFIRNLYDKSTKKED